MWDLFISHASEDKEDLVRPLADELVKYGVEVWYDEFSLGLGDSLTASIDKGLINSKFGLIIISPAFFQKRWTEYELRSLLTKEINGGKVILPIWHNVTADFVASQSLFLADKKAITSELGVETLAYEIVKAIRPDIINSHLLKKACREMVTVGRERVPLKELEVAEGIRHESLPHYLVIASKLLSTLLPIGSFRDVVIDFAKDADYDEEFTVWVVIACAYVDAMREFGIPFSNEKLSSSIFSYLLLLSLGSTELCEEIDIDKDVKMFLLKSYRNHSQVLFPLVKNNI